MVLQQQKLQVAELATEMVPQQKLQVTELATEMVPHPSRNSFTPYGDGHSVQQRQEGSPMAQYVDDTDYYSDDASIVQKPLDYENNGLIWYPPPAEDENDEAESNFFSYDDEDEDVGDSGAMFTSSSSLSSTFPAKEKREGNERTF
ncbi:hypothetical protein V6N11_027494 [Hibiscus sabdariffa]|uniref:Uncharacterized protein n=1 Tax=Hibiscus sabdariffa TaxID=183260 RepID=A0ABR2PHG0_9ROSI